MHNPYNYHIAVRDDSLFFGRTELLDQLVSGLSAPVPISTALFGGRRIGKTSLLSKLARMLSAEAGAAGGRRFVPCILDLQRGRPLTCSDDFFLWVLDEFGSTWERQHALEAGMVVDPLQTIYRSKVSRGPVEAFVRAFQSLDTKGERLRLVILLDESEEIMAVEWGEDLRPNLRALLSNSPLVEDVALVMAGATQMYTQITERDSPLENIMDRCTLSGLSREATIALARVPNDGQLPEEAAEEIWRQTGGHPCIAQYLLHEIWGDHDGELQEVTAEEIRAIAETFDERTRHFSTWARTLGEAGYRTYRLLAEQPEAVTYTTLRQSLQTMSTHNLRIALDALIYHGLVQCTGHGKRCRYQVSGQMYCDWFLAAGEMETLTQARHGDEADYPHIVIQGDYIMGDVRMGDKVAVRGDGNVIGDGSQAFVDKSGDATLEAFLAAVALLEQRMAALTLDPETLKEVGNDLQVVRSQASTQNPRRALLLTKLEGLCKLLPASGRTETERSQLQALAQQAWALGQTLFA